MALTIILEILLIAVLVGGSYYGIVSGFFKLATKPLKFIAALLFAYVLCGVVGKFVIAPIIQSPITNYVKDFMYEHCDSLEPGEVVNEIPTLLKMAGAAFNVNVMADPTATTDEMLNRVINDLTFPAVQIVGMIFGFILLFIIGKLLISLGIWVVNSYVSVGVLGKVNRVMGFVLAFVLSFLAAWVFVGLLDFIFHLGVFDGSDYIRNFKGGLIYQLMASFSPIELLLSF